MANQKSYTEKELKKKLKKWFSDDSPYSDKYLTKRLGKKWVKKLNEVEKNL